MAGSTAPPGGLSQEHSSCWVVSVDGAQNAERGREREASPGVVSTEVPAAAAQLRQMCSSTGVAVARSIARKQGKRWPKRPVPMRERQEVQAVLPREGRATRARARRAGSIRSRARHGPSRARTCQSRGGSRPRRLPRRATRSCRRPGAPARGGSRAPPAGPRGHAREERRLVAPWQLAAHRTAQPPQYAEDQLYLARRVEVGQAVEYRFALGPEDDARGEDVPLDELAGGQALAHSHALVRPQVQKVESLVAPHRLDLVGPEV